MGKPMRVEVPAEPLTAREVEILERMAEGDTDREIGRRLHLAVSTIKWYNKRIYRKLDVHNRRRAAKRAAELGLLREPERSGSEPDSPGSRLHLPASISSFVGRTKELEVLGRLLRQRRLVSIVGPAGAGKTRLALEAGRAAAPEFQGAVFLVPLAHVAEPSDLPWAIAKVIEFPFRSQADPADQLLAYLRDRHLLLILDNMEHLLEGAESLSRLLAGAPHLQMLVTTREPLGLYGEVTFPLQGLAVPPKGEVVDPSDHEAVALFVERASAIRPSWSLADDQIADVVRICRLTEGLPLAIELAAGWLDVLPPKAVADALMENLDILRSRQRGVLDRGTSIRAAFERSWSLLDPEQRAAFRRLSVFQGGFTRQAAQAVCGVRLAVLRELVGKSLVRFVPEVDRYELHQLLRYYASDALENAGESEKFARKHAEYYADWTAGEGSQLTGEKQQASALRIEAEMDNLRAAWEEAIAARNWQALLDLASGLWVLIDLHGWYPAGIELFQRAIAAAGDDGSREAERCQGWLLAVAGLFHVAGGYDSREGFRLASEGVSVLHETGRPQDMIIPSISLTLTAIRCGDKRVARSAAEDCLTAAEAAAEDWGTAKARQLLALLAVQEGDLGRAEELAGAALESYQRRHDRWSESVLCIEVLGAMEIARRDLDSAEGWIRRGLQAARTLDFRYSIQMANWQLGYLEALRENYQGAGGYWQRALEVGDRVMGSKHVIGFGGSISSGLWEGERPKE